MSNTSVVSQKYFIKIGTTKEGRKSKLVIPAKPAPAKAGGRNPVKTKPSGCWIPGPDRN